MKAKYLLIASALTTLPGFAQETYENEKLTGSDLNGTARYVGMGGAMEAQTSVPCSRTRQVSDSSAAVK